jgi:predicted RNA-binding Zn ribbon-like protein
VLFAHDTEAALSSAAELVNTAHAPDTLTTPDQLVEYTERWGYTGLIVGDAPELDAVRAARPRLERLWRAGKDEVVEIVNAMLREAPALPQLVRHGTWDYHLHAVAPEADLVVRVNVETAMAMVDVIRMDELSRLRICAADDCRNVVFDLSKNRSKRFCDSGCGNRANVAAYRARRSAG